MARPRLAPNWGATSVPRKRAARRRRAPMTWRRHLGRLVDLGSQSAVKQLKKKLGLNTENKNWDTSVTAAATGTLTQVLTPFANITVGSTNQQRNGHGIRVTHYKFRGTLQSAGIAPYSQQRVRVIWTLQRNVTTAGAYATAAQLLEFPGNIDSPYNTDLVDLKVVSDKTFLLAPYTSQVVQVPYKFKWDPSYDDGHVQWLDSDLGGLAANQVQGLLQCFLMFDLVGPAPQMSGYGRVHYVDN